MITIRALAYGPVNYAFIVKESKRRCNLSDIEADGLL